MAQAATTTAIRSYRIYLRDAENVLAQGHDVDLASDEDARELAGLCSTRKLFIRAQRCGTARSSFARYAGVA